MINSKRYYLLNEEVSFDEDLKHEFKNHLCFTSDNITFMSKKLHMMKPISQSINALRNSGLGDKIYLGINDYGPVQENLGPDFESFQRDQIQVHLEEYAKRCQSAAPWSWNDAEFIGEIKTRKKLEEILQESINAFLNSGLGGTIYLGIRDCGTVRGHFLTDFQQDHIQLCLQELTKRYHPAVPRSWIEVEFIRVVETVEEFEQLLKVKMGIVNGRLKPHSLGHVNCWCQHDAKTRMHERNERIPSFVIEITIKSWDPDSEDNKQFYSTTNTRLHPIFEDEHGDVWMRRLAGNRKYTKEEIFELTVKEVEDYYNAKSPNRWNEVICQESRNIYVNPT